MERRAALAIGLSLLILYLYQAFVLRPGTPVPPPQTTAATSAPASTSADTGQSGSSNQQGTPVEAVRPAGLVTEAAERTIVVDNGKVEAVLTNRGGRLLHWRLKHYLDGKREPFDLVPAGIPSNLPRPLSLALGDAQLSSRANEGLFLVTGDDNGRLDATNKKATLVF